MGLFKNGVGRPSNETIKKRRIFYVALVAVLGLTVAFAALSTTLTINGQAKVNKSSWNVHFENLELKEEKGRGVGNKVGEEETDAKIEESGIEINNLEGELYQPQDSVKYQVDVVNEGSIDALVTIEDNIVNNHPEVAEVKAVYTDGKSITEERSLEAGKSLTLTVEISYKDITDPNLLLQEESIVTLNYSLTANQDVSTKSKEEGPVTELNTGDTLPSGFAVAINGGEYFYANEEDIETLKSLLGTDEINILGNTVPELNGTLVIIDLNNNFGYGILYDVEDIYKGFDLRPITRSSLSQLDSILKKINGKSLISLKEAFLGNGEIVDFSEYDIPDTVVNINEMLFENSNLEKAPSIPVSVTSAWDAFLGCPKLEEVTYEGTLEQFRQIHGYDEIGDNGLVVHCTDGDYTVGSE